MSDLNVSELLNGFQSMNLSAMTEPTKCQVIWHYGELCFSPESFTKNIDWINQIINLKSGQTSICVSFTYFSGFRRRMSLDEIIRLRAKTECSTELARIEILKEWATSDLGLSTIFKDTEIKGLIHGNYIAVPILDNALEIHMCIIGLIRHKIGFMLRVATTPTQRFTMFIDLADGFQNRLSITGTIQSTGLNIFKAIFELLKKRPIIDYLDLIANLPPTPFIQMVYNVIPYFPELQVIWTNETSPNTSKLVGTITTASIDQLNHKSGKFDKLTQYNDKLLSRRANSILFKSLINTVRNHSTSTKTNYSHDNQNKTISSNSTPFTRFSALWPEVMDVVAD